MSITEPTPMAQTVTPPTSNSAAAQKKARSVPKKPNQDEKTKTLKEIDDKIAQIRPELDTVRDAISSFNEKKEADPRTALRKRMGELRDQQAANKKGKQTKVDQLNALQTVLTKKIADLKVLQDKLPFKTIEAVDAQINKLNKQIESGKIKLVEEKRFLSEVSSLTKSKKSIDACLSQQKAIDADKEAISALKETIDDSAARALSDEYNKIQGEVDEISKSKDAVWKQRNDLFDERTRLQRELEVEHQRKKAVNDGYFTAIREHSKFLQDEQTRRREEFQQKKQQELEGKRLAIAKEEREMADIPAFQAEITTCDSVYKYLLQFSHDQKRVTEAAAASDAVVADTPNTNIRQADATANVPSGVMLAKKSEKLEEVFYVGGGKSKKTKGPKEKKSEGGSLKLPLAVVEQLLELKVIVPTSVADLGNTLDALSEKSNTFKADQDKATAENKRKAEERIAKLTLSDLNSVEAIVEKTEIVAEVEAAA